MYVWNLVANSEGGTYVESVEEWGAEGDIWP